ncbi:uncharacterized protein LOC107046317 [Diachasma alloeum]|uniref:uncharacterized protein LOC107046317 n=1 Tax=Diachasma alloeum TaxID=454923 RepID=UPI000738419F|nr:uncharacterized protein LOC107046317 [Diachasma alloeum]
MAPTTTPEELAARRKALINERGMLKGRMTKFYKYLVDSNVYASIPYVDKNFNIIQCELENMPAILRELQTLEPNVDHADIHEEIDDQFEAIRVLVEKFKSPGRTAHPDAIPENRHLRDHRSPSVTSRSCSFDFLKTIPKLEAKKFDGKLSNWRGYRDWFLVTIHRNDNLSDSQRLDYLNRTCEGEAADTIKAFAITDENYAVAWSLLENTYDIQYALVLNHYDQLMETPVMKRNTPEEMKKLTNSIQSQVLALKALGENVEQWNTPLVHIILRRLDKETSREWNRKMQGREMPKYEALLTFLREEATRTISVNPLSASSTSPSSSMNVKPKHARDNKNRTQTLLTNATSNSCPHCKGQHTFATCEKVLALPPLDRIQAARTAQLCLNCFQKSHKTRVCKASTCSTCQKKHHNILHLNEEETKMMRAAHQSKTIAMVATLPSRECIITAVVNIMDSQQKPIQCRAILDTAAGSNFMTEALANKLRLSREKLAMRIEGLNDATTAANSLVSTTIQSRFTSFTKSLNFLTVKNIGGLFPMEPVDRTNLQIPRNIRLADPLFDRPAPVDILISVGTTLSMLCQGQIRLNDPKDPDVILQQTQLGWILGGNPLDKPSHNKSPAVQCNLLAESQFDVQKFWEIEEIPSERHLSKEEQLCEAHFQENITHDSTGRYVVALPFNEKRAALCNTKSIAESRLRSLQRKFGRNPELGQQYKAVLQEYIDLGHLSEVEDDPKARDGFYLPRHAVIKTASLTTKLNTVTFGLASAPYLVIRCLSQLAEDEGKDYPEAALRIKRDLYVDDLLTGADSLEEALKLRDDITTVLKRGGLNIRQWASNHPQLLENLPEGSVNLQLEPDKDATIKALGVHWDSQQDTIVYTVKPVMKTVKLTKRSILSDLAKIFDPLGLLGPIIIRGKIIMQNLWKERIDWDDPVPLSIQTEWKSYTDELMQLKDESFDRKIIISNAKEIQLHGFCDASEKAYGACIYLKTIDDQGNSQTSLLCAKSRVAPIKQEYSKKQRKLNGDTSEQIKIQQIISHEDRCLANSARISNGNMDHTGSMKKNLSGPLVSSKSLLRYQR